MGSKIICPACDAVVYPDALVVSDHNFGFTWLGDRAKWTHRTFGVVHLCTRQARRSVLERDPRPVANPPWLRVLCRWRIIRHGGREFQTRVLVVPNL